MKKEARKKIIYIVESFSGGVYQIIKDLSNHLIEEYDIIIAYGKREQTPKNFKKEFDSRIQWREIVNFTKNISLYKDIRAMKEINNLIKNERPDIIHLHSSKAGAIGRLINTSNIKICYTPHGFSFFKKDVSVLKRKTYWCIEKFLAIMCKKCTIIACSDSEYKEAVKLGKKVKLINNGIEIEKLKNNFKEIEKHKIDWDKIKICTVGRIDYSKNPRQFNEIAKEFPEIEFKWIGDGDLKLKKMLLSKNIIITGWLSNKDVFKEINKSDIFILTSSWEGMPVSLLEAMYCRKTCVVSNVVGNRDVIENGKNGYIANDSNEFKEIIKDVIQQKRQTTIDKAYSDVVTKYNIVNMVKKYKQIYEE